MVFILSLILLINFYAHLHKLELPYLISFVFEDGSRFLIGPLIFLYIKSIFHKGKNFWRRNWLHLLPYFVYLFAVSIPLTLTLGVSGYSFGYLIFLVGTQNFTLVKDLFFIAYLLLSIILFGQYKRKMESNYSAIELQNYNWIGQMVYGTLSIVILDTLLSLYELMKGGFSFEIGYVTIVGVVFLLVYLLFFGMSQTSIFLPDFLTAHTLDIPRYKNAKHPTVSLEEVKTIEERLGIIITSEKPYLQQELTLNILAELIGVPDKKLSSYLNHSLNTSFYDYVNKCRVEEVKEKLQSEEYQKYSLLGLAFSAGFNSKSSFYRAFKKETGISPTDFRKKASS